MPGFLAIHPEVSIDLASALHPVDFDESPFDAVIQRAVMARNDTNVFPLFDESLITVAAPSLVEVDHELTDDDFMQYPFIQLATRPELWNEWFANAGIVSSDRLQGPRFQHFDMVISAAQAGMGIALLPDIFVQQAMTSGALHQVHRRSLNGPTPYALICPKSREVSSAMNSFTTWLQATA